MILIRETLLFPHARLTVVAAALAAALAHPGASALAQNAAPAAQAPAPKSAQAPAAAAKMPAVVLAGLLTGTPESLLALKQYLAAVAASPDDVAKRALDLVQQLKESGIVRDPALIIAAAERVTQAVTETLSAAKITQLKIDRNFRPPAGVIALDFAPPDAKAREGFKKVLPNDAMLSGQQVQGVRRPGDDTDLLADGVAGIEKISMPMPDGEYRVTLMTEHLGDASTGLSPFGQKIVANGQPFNVAQATPDAWLKQSVLSNSGLGGFQSATERQGGAVTVTVKVTGGKLDMGFDMGAGGGLKTYLTGMVIEPANRPSVLSTVPEVRNALYTAPETRARYESQIASSVANLLEQTSPSAGPETDALSRPVQTVQQASPG
jgi:hypothetical protein